MNILKKITYVSAATLTISLIAPTVSAAEATSNDMATNSGSSVHKVSHAIASQQNYSSGSTSGYKWGQKRESTSPVSKSDWTATRTARSGYKWGNGVSPNSKTQPYAGTSSNEWNSMGHSDQAAYKWGRRSFSEQNAYKWGRRSFSEQNAYKWGRRSFSEQNAYKWGRRSFSEQNAYKWGRRSFSEQNAYKWGRRSFSEQNAYKWGRR